MCAVSGLDNFPFAPLMSCCLNGVCLLDLSADLADIYRIALLCAGVWNNDLSIVAGMLCDRNELEAVIICVSISV